MIVSDEVLAFVSYWYTAGRWNIYDAPKETELSNSVDKLVEVNRFYNVCVYTKVITVADIPLFKRRGK